MAAGFATVLRCGRLSARGQVIGDGYQVVPWVSLEQPEAAGSEGLAPCLTT